MPDVLVRRYAQFFHHPNKQHEVLRLGDRAVACANLRHALDMLGLDPGSMLTGAEDQLYDEPLREAVRAFQVSVRHRVTDGLVGQRPASGSYRSYCTAMQNTDLLFSAAQWFYIVEDPRNGPWRVRTAGYQYTIETQNAEEILGYHWHPTSASDVKEPHLHLGSGARIGRAELETTKAHLPTGRVAMEDFIRLLIEVFDANPRRDWKEVLKAGADRFRQFASWGNKPPQR